MAQQTAMQQLLAQLKDERQNLVMTIEWDRCYQAIEMAIETTYLPIEKEQIINAFNEGNPNEILLKDGEQYYNETY